MARVLVVEDVAVMRRAIVGAIDAADGLEVVGEAADGEAALTQIRALRPDLISLDLEMPRLDGLGVLRALRDGGEHMPPIVVFSARSTAGAHITMQALATGAADFVLKPTAEQGRGAIERELIPKLQALAGTAAPPTHAPATPPPPRPAVSARFHRRLLLIASSTGGPNALREALAAFPADFPAPILVVQHIPPLFSKSLAESINRDCPIKVCEAGQGELLEPGTVYIVPGDQHARLRDRGNLHLHLDQGPTVFGLRPAADVTLASLDPSLAAQTVVAVFTGMGRDGLEGCRHARAHGARICTQSAASCIVYGMPRAVDEADLSEAHFAPRDCCATVSRLGA